MAESEKVRGSVDPTVLAENASAPLVFISHDSRDAELAEAFAKLLKSVSAGMIKTFRSSDKKGSDGIDFGEEWFKRLMSKLQSTSDVVCLFTERSIDRPWILFEAGVAKGKLNAPVIGVALGVSLNRVGVGPFYQFQNMDDSAADLSKLVHQLARRVPNLELDADVVGAQVQAFKATEDSILKTLKTDGTKRPGANDAEENSIAKLVEEMKTIPSRVAERLAEVEGPHRRRRMQKIHPMMFDEIMHMSGHSGDPMAILMAASMVREEMPWLYELAAEAYQALKTGTPDAIENELKRLHRVAGAMFHGPFTPELGFGSKNAEMFAMELPRMIERALRRALDARLEPEKKKAPTRRKATKTGTTDSVQ
jgi:hypothetical protein